MSGLANGCAALERKRRELSANLSPSASVLLDVLVGWAIREGAMRLTVSHVELIWTLHGMSRNTLRRSIRELVSAKLLYVDVGGGIICSTYELIFAYELGIGPPHWWKQTAVIDGGQS